MLIKFPKLLQQEWVYQQDLLWFMVKRTLLILKDLKLVLDYYFWLIKNVWRIENQKEKLEILMIKMTRKDKLKRINNKMRKLSFLRNKSKNSNNSQKINNKIKSQEKIKIKKMMKNKHQKNKFMKKLISQFWIKNNLRKSNKK